MYSIQNLTKSVLKFQGVTIGAYATITVPVITDYITLSRLSNSGKIRYFNTPVKKTEAQNVSEPIIEKAIEEVKVEETIIPEIKEEKVEKKDTSLFSLNYTEEKDTKQSDFDIPEKLVSTEDTTKTTKKSGNKRNKRSDDK